MSIIFLCTILVGIVSSLFVPTVKEPVTIGDQAPEFELQAIGNSTVRLSDQLHNGKTKVLVFSRASWCPFCLRQLIEFRRNAEKFERANAEVIFIFREESKGIDGLKEIQARAKSSFTMALDNGSLRTSGYSAGEREFSTYIIADSGSIITIVKGDVENRAKSQRVLDIVESL